ncbi:hypothetical protein GCM10009809_15130 [Isoptericola hypogeus]|uniref:Activator of Hsp90 ATPase homologue 1/2-like C-terminal domain-containing protein n=1 Tax=Isoptericola hypogeus TaxID=300179 RepID=A0ABP4V9U3_9MICO
MTCCRTGAVTVDQVLDAPPATVWRALTEPELHAQWWAESDVAEDLGHGFHLEMPGFGSIRAGWRSPPARPVRVHV